MPTVEISVRVYGQYQKLKVDLEDDVTVFFGRNGAGKSQVLTGLLSVQDRPTMDPSSRATAYLRFGANSVAHVFIDDVDMQLDKPSQAEVIDKLRKRWPNAMLVVTTNSEQVIGSVPSRCVRRVVAVPGDVPRIERVHFADGATAERILIELLDARR